MTLPLNSPALKEINALKKRLNWGEVSSIYQMVSSSTGDLDGILTSGFDSAYKRILDRETWNLTLLGGYKDAQQHIQVKIKPQISLRHAYTEMGYELHAFPVINGEKVSHALIQEPNSPFITWMPETTRMLFRINSFIAFAIFTYQRGDEADLLLVKYAYYRVNELIKILQESFDVIEVKGFNIAEFYQEIARRNGNILSDD
jgi:hypothetical protein